MKTQGVSRAHSTRKGKERTRSVKKLHPQYIVGFIDGEGSFSIGVYKDKTMRNKVFVKPELEIELRADDREILERIQKTFGCGRIYECNYERYGWYPHVKYKISRLDDLCNVLIPFFEKYPPQAKKAQTFKYFKQVVEKRKRKEHLTKKGIKEILEIREKARILGKKHRSGAARIRENRSSSGVGRKNRS